MKKVTLLTALLCCALLLFGHTAWSNPRNNYHIYQQTNEYRGVVLDQSNKPVADAIISVANSAGSTKTDSLGQFMVRATPGDILLISHPDYFQLKHKLTNRTELNLTLANTDGLITDKDNEPVQLIYYAQPRSTSIASTDAVYSRDILKSPVASFRNALTGRLAGLFTLQGTGLPGADGASLTLRGQAPIIIIDGVVSSLTSFDLEEIESITVVKDALGNAMLGSRGSKGAVVVTTKKGKVQRQLISFTAQTAIQKPLDWVKPLNAYDYARLRNEALRNDGIDSLNSGLYFTQTALDAWRNGSDPATYPDVNYRDAITKKSSTLNRYTLSVNGGNKFARYFVSMEHLNQSGFFKTVDSNSYNTNNNFKSYVIRTNVDVNITNKLSGGIYLLGRILNANEPGATTGSIFSSLLNTPSITYPLLNPDGSFGGTQIFQNNVWAQTIGSGYRQRYFRDILVNIYLKQSLDDIAKGLWIKGKVAYNSTLAEDINRSKTFAVYQKIGANYLQFGTNGTQNNANGIAYQGRSDYEELSIGYDKTINSYHGLNILLLANRDNSTDAGNAQALPYTVLGTSGRVAYNYKGKYMVEGAFGLNGSNRYPDNGKTKLGFFPSIGLGWNIEQEDFLKPMTWISQLKLYVTYGKNGWDNPGYFVYYPRYFDGPSPFFGTGAGQVTSITEGPFANRNIDFEKSNKLNVGLSGSLLKSKLGFTIEYFNNKHYDLLMQRGDNSTIIGNDYPDENIGKNRYSGWEFLLNWHDKLSNKLQYFVSLNASSIGSEALFIDEPARAYDWMMRTGQPVGQRFGYIAEGLFQNQTEINSSAVTAGYVAQPGDIKYRDLNNDGIIDQNDVTAIGTTKPLFFYGLSVGLAWNGFDVSALLQGVSNRDVYLSGGSYWGYQDYGVGQAYEHNLNRWTPANAANATYPRLTYGANPNNNAASSYWVRNGNYLRLKNAEIGYSLPLSLIKKIKLNTVRVFINGFNLFTKSSDELDGRDPESYDGSYPLQRLVNFGINIKF
ncbi:MAG TPA: SusC/RagA family TonB-linked outer membrane protein [Chitinophagaceae bacterium]|jgi:TonB-linked SusC/RagA family outer membrane protein|nr:SusC/RagA family TonB-linked outer membrane protein [Chitinophagaceae bacterium]